MPHRLLLLLLLCVVRNRLIFSTGTEQRERRRLMPKRSSCIFKKKTRSGPGMGMGQEHTVRRQRKSETSFITLRIVYSIEVLHCIHDGIGIRSCRHDPALPRGQTNQPGGARFREVERTGPRDVVGRRREQWTHR